MQSIRMHLKKMVEGAETHVLNQYPNFHFTLALYLHLFEWRQTYDVHEGHVSIVAAPPRHTSLIKAAHVSIVAACLRVAPPRHTSLIKALQAPCGGEKHQVFQEFVDRQIPQKGIDSQGLCCQRGDCERRRFTTAVE
jgi:hypothetical protein